VREGVFRLSDRDNLGAAIGTPWGDASELKLRRLYPGGGTPPEEVARNQRERLFGAVVAVASQEGYEAMTVADVLELSGVSRSAFYKHFANKSECLTAAASELLEPALRTLRPATAGGEHRAPREVFERFLALLDSEPAAARVCFVELHSAGEAGEVVADTAFETLTQAVTKIAGASEGPDPHSALIRALVGGIRKLVHTRFSRGEGGELRNLAPELWQWLTSVVPPPGELESPRRQRAPARARFEGYTPAERIAHAVAAVVAEKGYPQMNTDDVAAAAAISLSTFYAHYSDKRDAVLGALEMSGAQITAIAVPAARRASHWEEGVRALYESICAYFVAEPEMAQLALVGVYGAGPRARARRDRVIDSLTTMLAPAFAAHPEAPAVSAEAIGATVYALMREQVRREGAESLGAVVPLATYVTLVGFIGPERALAAANGRARRG
jgi:AcrR family transcriptional regulator